jgi:hypothetical protein
MDATVRLSLLVGHFGWRSLAPPLGSADALHRAVNP